MSYRLPPRLMKDIAIQRIRLLAKEALDALRRGETNLARRYCEIAWRIAQKVQIKNFREIFVPFCRNCLTPLVPGATAEVRIREKRVVVKCRNCGKVFTAGKLLWKTLHELSLSPREPRQQPA